MSINESKKLSEIEMLENENRLDDMIEIKADTALCLGNFDGTHMGHIALFKELKKTAQTLGLKTLVLILKSSDKSVTDPEERKKRLYDLDIDYVVEMNLDDRLKSMPAEEFLRDILIDRFNMKAIVAGEDVSFGYKRQGNAQFLKDHADEYGYEVVLIKKIHISDIGNRIAKTPFVSGADTENTYKVNGSSDYAESIISSTLLRDELSKGHMIRVSEIMGHPFTLSGTVVHGKGLGSSVLGFPTMNIEVEDDRLLPPSGAYAVKLRFVKEYDRTRRQPVEEKTAFNRSQSSVSEDKEYEGIANLGCRPTVTETDKKPSGEGNKIWLEIHLFDYHDDSGQAYGRNVTAALLKFIRPEKKFSGLDELRQQLISEDIPAAQSFFRV